MSNTTTEIELLPRPLVAADKAGLLADLVPREFWEPTFLLETRPDEEFPASATTLAAAPDHWRLLVHPPSAMRDLVFYPLALSATFVDFPQDAGFATFWEIGGGVAISPPALRNHAWYPFDLEVSRDGFNTIGAFNYQAGLPSFRGFPIRPVRATGANPTDNALGGFIFRVKTFDATTKSQMHVVIDGRWLGFPQSVLRSAGFYLPGLYFKTN